MFYIFAKQLVPRWWQLRYFLFSSLTNLGEMIQFDEHIFQMGGKKTPTRFHPKHISSRFCWIHPHPLGFSQVWSWRRTSWLQLAVGSVPWKMQLLLMALDGWRLRAKGGWVGLVGLDVPWPWFEVSVWGIKHMRILTKVGYVMGFSWFFPYCERTVFPQNHFFFVEARCKWIIFTMYGWEFPSQFYSCKFGSTTFFSGIQKSTAVTINKHSLDDMKLDGQVWKKNGSMYTS